MRRVVALGVLVGVAAAGAPSGQRQTATLFEGARLIVGDGRAIESGAFVVENGRLIAVGERNAVRAPVGAARVDLTGKTVMPALVNAHVHLVRDREADEDLVALMRDRGVAIIPNMAISENGTHASPPEWLDDPLLGEVTAPDDLTRIRASFGVRTPQAVERATNTYRGMERSLARLNAAGVKIAFGTDAGALRDHVHAFTDHRELHLMVRAGLTPMEAIVAATRGSAGLAGLDDHGTLAAGKSADFIVLDANPLDDIRNTRRIGQVYLRGAQVDRQKLRSSWGR